MELFIYILFQNQEVTRQALSLDKLLFFWLCVWVGGARMIYMCSLSADSKHVHSEEK